MALTSAKQIKGQLQKLRKELTAAVTRAEKQRKQAQDSLGGLLNRAKQTLSSLGGPRLAKLLDGGRKKSPAKKAAKRATKAAKSAQKKVSRAAKTAQRKATSSVKRAQKAVDRAAKKAVKTVRKSPVGQLASKSRSAARELLKSAGISSAPSRAALATSKAKAAVGSTQAPTPAQTALDLPPVPPTGPLS
jgi:hypothetical protein